MEHTTIALIILVPLLVWRLYSRMKRLMVRQKSLMWRHWAAVIVFPVLTALAAAGSFGNTLGLGSLGAGLLAGAWAGLWGIKLTRFENTEQGLFFTPNQRLGIAVAMLFSARVIYHFLEIYLAKRQAIPTPPPHEAARSPLTLVLFGLLAGYYSLYAWGLLRWHRSQKPLATDNDIERRLREIEDR